MNDSDTDGSPVPDDSAGADSSRTADSPGVGRSGMRSGSRYEDDLRSRLAEKETLLREVDHRVKNDIATLSAYLSLQAHSLPDHSFERMTLMEARTRLEIRTELEELPLDSRKLYPLGMAVNELVANAIKHAFPEGRKGVVTVSLRRVEDGSVAAEVEDDGIGMPAGENLREGLGRALVPALAAQIGGVFEEAVPPGRGSAFRIRIP